MGSALEKIEYSGVSKKKNINKIVIGFLFLLLSGTEIFTTVLVCKNNWMTNLFDALILGAIIIGAVFWF